MSQYLKTVNGAIKRNILKRTKFFNINRRKNLVIMNQKVEENKEFRNQADKICNIVDKFRLFKMDVKSNEKKLKEAETVIDRLKEEITILKDVENVLRNQLSSAQVRLTKLQSSLGKMTIICEQQRQNEHKCNLIEKKVEDLNKLINETRNQAINLHTCILKDTNQEKKYQNLKLVLRKKESEFDLMKMEVQSLKKEKQEIVAQNSQNLKGLEIELQKLKLDYSELKSYSDRTLEFYKKQIEDNEQKIKSYDRERNCLLEEFELLEGPASSNNIILADSTVSIVSEECVECHEISMKKELEPQAEEDRQTFFCSTYSDLKPSIEKKFKNSTDRKNNKFSKLDIKEKPKLDCIVQSSLGFSCQESIRKSLKSPQPPIKRRLFSTNSNHYLN